MNRDEILRMAEELVSHIEEFAEKIAAAEREACADLCSDILNQCGNRDYGYWEGVTDCSAAILARGQE